VERTVSREELAAITSILCESVPDMVNKSNILTRHFSKFGEVRPHQDSFLALFPRW
jgi:hypothetical protein